MYIQLRNGAIQAVSLIGGSFQRNVLKPTEIQPVNTTMTVTRRNLTSHAQGENKTVLHAAVTFHTTCLEIIISYSATLQAIFWNWQ
jgi:hypothetical protein